MLKHISLLGWLVMAVLLIDAGIELRRQDWWGAARTLFIVAAIPFVLRPKSAELRPPTS